MLSLRSEVEIQHWLPVYGSSTKYSKLSSYKSSKEGPSEILRIKMSILFLKNCQLTAKILPSKFNAVNVRQTTPCSP